MSASKPLVLVTGGAGFIGSNLVHMLLSQGRYRVRVLDALTYAGNLENLADLKDHPDFEFVRGDIANPDDVARAFSPAPDLVMHLAAESHVDRSLEDPGLFLTTNVMGTQVLLQAARAHKIDRFLHVSTDEVYGSLGKEGLFTETSPIQPSSPYSASKASSDLLALATHHTFGLDVVVTRCSNNYGPYQFPEKLIPLMISNALEDKDLPVYGDGQQIRDWIHVDDHCRGLIQALESGKAGEVYNLGGRSERTNMKVVQAILSIVGKPESLIRHVEDRLGHDRRYAIDDSYAQAEIGFVPQVRFEEGLEETVRWYQENQTWWQNIKSGAYREYYQRHYGSRLTATSA